MRAVFRHPSANRLLALALVAVLLLTGINLGRLTTYASFGTKEYQIGEDVFASLDADGHMRLYGTGDTYDYAEAAPAPFYERAAEVLTLQIDAGITGIGAYLFYNCENLSGRLAIPSTVISIGSRAFSGTTLQSAPKLGSIENRFVATEIVETVEPEEPEQPAEQPDTDAVEPSETPTPSETPAPSESAEPTDSAEPISSEQPESGEAIQTPAIPEPVTAVESGETLVLSEAVPLSAELPQETQQASSPEPNAEIPEQTRIVVISSQEIGEGIFFPGQTGVFSVYEAGNSSFASAAATAGYSQILSWQTVSFSGANETVELSVPLTAQGLFLPSFAETGLPLPGGVFSTVSFLCWQAQDDEGEYQPQSFAPVTDSFTAAFSVVERETAEKTIEKKTDDGTTVAITGALPENAEVYAETVELTPEMLGIMTESSGGETPEVLFALDISILVDGEKFQPSESPVTVLITPPALPKDAEVAVTHVVVDEGTGEVLESQSVADVSATADGAVEFAAESFSIYIGTTAKTQVTTYPAVIYYNGTGFYSDEACTGDETKVVKEDGTDFATLQELVSALDGATTIYMKAAYTLTGTESIGNATHAVTLKRWAAGLVYSKDNAEFYAINLIDVPTGTALTLADITIDGGAVWTGDVDATLGRGTVNSGVVSAAANGMLITGTGGAITLNDGAILQNNSNGMAIFTKAASSLHMLGGEIRNNSSTFGTGIYAADKSRVSIEGGSIHGNSASNQGGAICARQSTVLMSGGSITGNYAASNCFGGGISVLENSTVSMSGGSVTGNYAGSGGGISAMVGSIITMSDGTISGNSSPNGKGIYLHDKTCTLNLSGSPTIEDSVYVYDDRVINVNTSGGDFTPTMPVKVQCQNTAVGTAAVQYDSDAADSEDFSLTNEGLRLVVNAEDGSQLIVERYVEHTTNATPGIKSGRHFTSFADGAAAASIPANGAFTLCLNVSYTPSDAASVRAHSLVTDTPLPAGTKITLCEYTLGRSGYYYYEAAGAQTVIPLAAFKRMGTAGGEGNVYAEPEMANTELNEILVISVQLPESGTATGEHGVSLRIGTTELGAFTVTTTAAEGSSGSVSLGATSAGAGTVSVPVTVTASGQGHKVLAFSLQDGTGAAKLFPTGAAASLGERTPTAIRGNLIIFDLGTDNLGGAQYTLSLTGLPAGSYKLRANICIVQAGDVSYPMRGSRDDAATGEIAVSEAEKYALKAALTSGGRILQANTQTPMTFTLSYAPASAEGFSAELYVKGASGGYSASVESCSATFDCSGGTGTATVTLPPLEPGTYRIIFSLGGKETPYNIIVE